MTLLVDRGDWRQAKEPPSADEKKRLFMRRATTAAGNAVSIGGVRKSGKRAPRPVSLPRVAMQEK